MRIRWGILSTARITDALIGPIKQAKRTKLTAAAGRSMDKARAFAQENDIAQAYGSYEEVLADPTTDVVCVPLPDNMHCDWTVKAAEVGKHVLCEKPMATTIEDSRENVLSE